MNTSAKLPKHLLGLDKKSLESMCVDCGLCCYASVPVNKSESAYVPELRCKHLEIEKSSGKSCCNVYENRLEVAKGWCMPLAEAIQKGLFPEQCPYVRDMKDYVGAKIFPDPMYKAMKPSLQKSMAEGGKPEWVDEEHWNDFLTEK